MGINSPIKRIGGVWQINKILINEIDSSIYLSVDSLNLITSLKISEDKKYNKNGGGQIIIYFKRRNDTNFSDVSNPFINEKDTIPGHYYADSTPILLGSHNFFGGLMYESDRDLLILNGLRNDAHLVEGMDFRFYYWFYTRRRLKRINGVNYYGGEYKIKKLTKKQMILSYDYKGVNYKLVFSKKNNP
ncbi:MAG: hypothetical protein IT239_03450 [Bacteroidia bacterium]|nr:hypothetical protein [Bacteroidia bacterium]